MCVSIYIYTDTHSNFCVKHVRGPVRLSFVAEKKTAKF